MFIWIIPNERRTREVYIKFTTSSYNFVYHLLKRVFSLSKHDKDVKDFDSGLPTFNSKVHNIILWAWIKISGVQHTAIDRFIFFCDRKKGEDNLTIRGCATSNYPSIVWWWALNLYCDWLFYPYKFCHKSVPVCIPYSPWNLSHITREGPTEVERGVNQSCHSLTTKFWCKLELGSCYKSKKNGNDQPNTSV